MASKVRPTSSRGEDRVLSISSKAAAPSRPKASPWHVVPPPWAPAPPRVIPARTTVAPPRPSVARPSAAKPWATARSSWPARPSAGPSAHASYGEDVGQEDAWQQDPEEAEPEEAEPDLGAGAPAEEEPEADAEPEEPQEPPPEPDSADEFDPWKLTLTREDSFEAPADDELTDDFREEEYGGFQDDYDPIEDIDPDADAAEAEEATPEAKPIGREGDLDLDDIPEDHREAVAGNLELKRALSQDRVQDSGKRRKLNSGAALIPAVENPVASRLVKQWRLDRDSTTTFVLRMADKESVEKLAKTRWSPNPTHPRSPAEQVYEQLTRLRERKGPPGGPLDCVGAFGHRFHLSASEDEMLAKLNHKTLRHVLKEFDGEKPLAEVVDDAANNDMLDDGELAVPDKPGLFVLGRSQCLELIDPFGDALVLGDANLTFSLLLAEHRKSLHHTGRTIATTFEKEETLRERYPEIGETIKQLNELGAEVFDNVDCTRLAVDPRFQGMEEKFGAVYYNFPHAGVVSGFFDGHPFVRWRHINLMTLFFRALRAFVKPGGCVKVASNSGATGVRYSDIIGGALASEFVHDETFPFLEWQLSRYRRSYGDRRDQSKRPDDGEVYNAQRAHSDMVYCFTYKPSGGSVAAAGIHFPPTKEELIASNEGRAGRLPSGNIARKKRVEELYELFLSYVQGVHVG